MDFNIAVLVETQDATLSNKYKSSLPLAKHISESVRLGSDEVLSFLDEYM